MPAIKGDMYINTHCNYSQPTLIKLYNENIGWHLTPLHKATRIMVRLVYVKLENNFESVNMSWSVERGKLLLIITPLNRNRFEYFFHYFNCEEILHTITER